MLSVNDTTNHTMTYMRMAQAGAGLGLGVKQMRTVMIFHDRAVLENFIQHGYVVGRDANLAAKYGDKGVAPVGDSLEAVAPSGINAHTQVDLYQFTLNGLEVDAMLNGYKYWPDAALN